MTKTFRITRHEVLFATSLGTSAVDGRSWSNYAVITCYGDGGMRMNIYFPQPGQDAQAVTKFDQNYGSVLQPIESMSSVMALFASGVPLWGYLNDENPYYNALSSRERI